MASCKQEGSKLTATLSLNAVICDGVFQGYNVLDFKGDGSIGSFGYQYIFVKDIEVITEVPKDFDWRKPAIAGAKTMIDQVRADAAAKIMVIEDWIGKLLALEAPK